MLCGKSLQRMIRCHESFDPLIPPEVKDPQDIKRIIASAPTIVLARSREYGGIQRASIQKPSQDQSETGDMTICTSCQIKFFKFLFNLSPEKSHGALESTKCVTDLDL